MTAAGRRWMPAVLPRAAGLVVLAVAIASVHWLFAAPGPGGPRDPGMLDLAVATAAFLCSSVGTALVLLGPHLLDPIEVSRRWAKRRSDR